MGRKDLKSDKLVIRLHDIQIFDIKRPRWWCHMIVSRLDLEEENATNPWDYGFRPMPSGE